MAMQVLEKNRLIEATIRLSETSPYGQFKLGALIAQKNTIISMGVNQKKTHSLQKRFQRYDHLKPHLHAEIHAISLARTGDLEGSDIYVARTMRSGGLGMSKPCIGCMEALRHFGIRRMVYYCDGSFIRETIQ